MKISMKLRATSLFLMTLMVFYVIPANCMKDLVSALGEEGIEENTMPEESAPKEIYVLGEDLSKREESAKHFRMSDGSYVAVQYAEPVHYLDENGTYTEYDNTLSLSQNTSSGLIGNLQSGNITTENITSINGYKANKSDVSITLANSATQSALTSISKGNYSVSIIPLSLNTSSKVVVNNTKAKPTLSGKPTIEEASKLYNHTSSVKYTNMFVGADLEYVLSGSKLKENIIVNEKATSYIYRFNLNLTGLYAVLNEDGSISLIGNNTDKVEFIIPKGYMFDNNGAYSENVEYTLTAKPNGNYTLTVTADSQWINSDDRAFPVTVDPTLFVGEYGRNNGVSDTYVASNSLWANSTRDNAMNLVVGYVKNAIYGNSDPFNTTKTYIKLNILPEVGKASVITSAELILRHDKDNQCNKNVKISVKEVSVKAQGTITWNNQPSVDSTILDYEVVKPNHGSINKNISWDITKAVKKWYEVSSSNKGLCLEEMSGTTSENTFVSFLSNNSAYYNNQNGIEPMFKICYRDTKGIDSRWSYNSFGTGNGGTLNVNLFNGNLVAVNSIMSSNGSILPVEIASVYNSYLANTDFQENFKSGYGWQLSVYERMDLLELGDINYIKYTTSTGTELYFSYQNGIYLSEDGYPLYITYENDEFIMVDDSNNVKSFYGDGKLKYIKDANGNKKTLHYYDNRLTRIQDVYTVDEYITSPTSIKFEYNSAGYLKKVINFIRDENYCVEYYYSSTPTGTLSTENGGYLRKVVHSNGKSASYEYNSNGLLTSVCDNETGIQYNLEYSTFHNSISQKSYKLKKITQIASNGIDSCSPFQIDYQEKRTVVRTWGSDEILNNGDDILTTYVFDSYGRTISAYSTDTSGKEIYGASNAEYIDVSINENGTLKDEYKKNNKIKTEGVSGYSAMNLLNNGNFENSGNWYVRQSSSDKSCVYQNTQKYIGNRGMKLYSPDNTGYVSGYQSVTLEAGTYTLSAYVKTENMTGNGAYLKLGDNISSKVNGTTSTSVENGWKRIYVTATLEAGSYDVSMFVENSKGTAYFDCIQLEKSNASSRFNLVENGGMDKQTTWSGAYETDSEKGTVAHVVSDYTSTKNSTQNIILNMDSTTSTFILKGWGKANSASLINHGNDNDTSFAITAKFTLDTADGEKTEEFSIDFNPSTNVWQYGSRAICFENKNATVTSVTVSLDYNYNVNEAWFDDISLTIEPAQTYTYDNNGNITQVTTADGNNDLSEYENEDSPSDITSYTNIYGEVYLYEYNVGGVNTHQVKKVTKTSANKTVTSEYTYDQYGNVTSEKVSNANGTKNLTSSQTYSNQGNYVSSITDANGITYEYLYDAKTNLLTMTKDGVDNTTRFVYDDKDRPTSVFADANNNEIKDVSESGVNYSYTASGYLSQIETASTAYVFSYDTFGNNTAIGIDGTASALATYTYGANNGKLQRTTYGNGTYIENVYDYLDRIVAIKYNGDVKYKFYYNGDGQLYRSDELQNNITYIYEYDSLGRLIRGETRYLDSQYAFLSCENMYDDLGRPSSSEYIIDGVEIKYNMSYYSNSTLIEAVTILYNGETVDVVYSYDTLERVDNKIISFGYYYLQYDYLYNDIGTTAGTLIKEIAIQYENNTDSLNYIYSYDNNGNIVQIKEKNIVKQSFQYDGLNQLIRENNAYSNRTYVYTYDLNGNILTKKTYTYTTGTLGTLLSTVNYTYGDDTWGDLLTNYNGTNISYDEIGNPLNWHNITSLTWGEGRRLTEYTYVKDGETYNVTFTYNQDGIRTSKVTQNANDPTYMEAYVYRLDGTRILSEIFIYNMGVRTLYFIYDASGDVIGFNIEDKASYYYGKNLQGDVVALFDSESKLVARYYYDAWGNVISTTDANGNEITSQTHVAHVNPIRYRSYYYDKDTGFYYVSSRYYDPEIGRWISPEPNVYTGAFDGGSGLIGYNVYAYCANNPVNFSDHTGEFILTALIVGVVAGAVIGGVIGGTVAYNSAKSSGLEGSDLFCATAGGVGKGALIGGVAGGLIGSTGGVVAAYGATSVAGTAMITAAATITAKATEVTALQAKKSANDGDNGWQIANDCVDSVFSNGGKIISPALTKAGTTSATYVAIDLIKHKVVPLGFNTFLHSAGGKVLPYGFAAYAWGHTVYSIFCTDPIARANQRGYSLR